MKIVIKEKKFRNLVHANSIGKMSGAGAHKTLKEKKMDRNSKISKREKERLKKYY